MLQLACFSVVLTILCRRAAAALSFDRFNREFALSPWAGQAGLRNAIDRQHGAIGQLVEQRNRSNEFHGGTRQGRPPFAAFSHVVARRRTLAAKPERSGLLYRRPRRLDQRGAKLLRTARLVGLQSLVAVGVCPSNLNADVLAHPGIRLQRRSRQRHFARSLARRPGFSARRVESRALGNPQSATRQSRFVDNRPDPPRPRPGRRGRRHL